MNLTISRMLWAKPAAFRPPQLDQPLSREQKKAALNNILNSKEGIGLVNALAKTPEIKQAVKKGLSLTPFMAYYAYAEYDNKKFFVVGAPVPPGEYRGCSGQTNFLSWVYEIKGENPWILEERKPDKKFGCENDPYIILKRCPL